MASWAKPPGQSALRHGRRAAGCAGAPTHTPCSHLGSAPGGLCLLGSALLPLGLGSRPAPG